MIHSRKRTLRTQKLLNASAPREFRADGRAPCVLGFHGFTGSASELRPLVDRIAQAGYAVDVPLMPGHGALPVALQETSFDDWAAAMRSKAAEMAARYGKVVFLGFSMGTLVALHLAADPDIAAHVAGVAVLGNALELHAYSSVPFAAFERFEWKVPDWYLVKVRAADMTDREAARALTTYDRHPLRAAFEVYRAGRRVRAEVARVRCPVFIGHGARDLVCRPRAAKWLAAHVGARDVTLRTYARSGHVVAADVERDAVSADVLAFLDHVARA